MGDAKSWNGLGTFADQRKLMAEQVEKNRRREPEFEQQRSGRRHEVSERIRDGENIERPGDRANSKRRERRGPLV